MKNRSLRFMGSADPTGRHTHRYWDGAQWTSQVADDGRTGEDALGGPGSGPSG